MRLLRAGHRPRGGELDAIGRQIETLSRPSTSQRLTPEQCDHRRFVLDLVELLAARHGFAPEELVDPRTGRPLGELIARMRETLRREGQS